jgi:prepilin-type N-terminal cleavage/methylation domain-containing protein
MVRHGTHRERGQRGFSLIEAILVVVILTMALLISLPNLHRTRVMAQANQETRSLMGLLELARFEALNRHSPVAVSVSSVGECLVFEDWNDGDPTASTNDDGSYDGPGEELIRRAWVRQKLQLVHPTGASAVQTGAVSSLVYRSDGSLKQVGGLPANPAVYLGDEFGNFFRVRVNRLTGSPRVEKHLGGSVWSPRDERWTWEY